MTAVTAGAALLVIVDFIVAPLTGHFSGSFDDFGPILAAGHAANAGLDPYAPFLAVAPTQATSGLPFDFLPLIAVLARPLAALPHAVAVTLWLWGIIACTIAASVITARTVLPKAWPRTAIGFSAAVLFAPALYDIWHGQMSSVVLLTLALAFRAWVDGDEITCGLALGVGAALRVSPAALLLLLIRRRWWRGIAVGAGVGLISLLAGGLLLGFDRLTEWFTKVLPLLGRANGWYFNQSAGALLCRLFNYHVWRIDPPSPLLQAAIVAVSAACVLGAAWVVRSGECSAERRSLELSAGILAMVLATTVAWWSDDSSLLIPLLAIAGLAARRVASRPVVVTAVALFLVAGVAAPAFLGLGGTGWLPSTFGTLWWWPALQLDSLPAWTALALLVALLVTLARSRAWPWQRAGHDGATGS